MTALLLFFAASIFGIGSILFACLSIHNHRDELHKTTNWNHR